VTTDKTAATASVLDMMTAGIMSRKSQAAAKLTPVAGEVPPIHKASTVEAAYSGQAGAPFPFDDPQTTVLALQKARAEVMHVLDGIDALLALYGSKPAVRAVVEDTAAERKAKERAADARAAAAAAQEEPFDERLERLTAEAQASVFAKVTETVTTAQPDAGWSCPKHGAFVKRTSRLGREYRACSECNEFERLT